MRWSDSGVNLVISFKVTKYQITDPSLNQCGFRFMGKRIKVLPFEMKDWIREYEESLLKKFCVDTTET